MTVGKPPRKARAKPDPAHDVLAADEFAVGEGDRQLHRDPPHDVLAAEEFAVPASNPRSVPPSADRGAGSVAGGVPGRPNGVNRLWVAGVALLALRRVRRRRRRRRAD
jgi:hypothetical protein